MHTIIPAKICGASVLGGRRLLDISPLNPNIAVNGEWPLGSLIINNSTYQSVEPTALLAVHGHVMQVLRQLS